MDILCLVTAGPSEKIESFEEKLKKIKVDKKQSESSSDEEMNSRSNIKLSYAKLPNSNRPYKDENGLPIILNDENCYRLQHISPEMARQCIERYLQKLFGYKINLRKNLEIITTEHAYITKTATEYFTKAIELIRTFKSMKPNNIKDGIKFLQKRKRSKFKINKKIVNEKEEVLKALLKAKNGLNIIDKSLKFVDCVKCQGFGFERCQSCDLNIANICTYCIQLIYKPTREKDCNLNECHLRAKRDCVYGYNHRFCKSCLGKGKVFQFASIKAEVDQNSKKECKPSDILLADDKFKVRSIEKRGLLQGVKMKTEIIESEVPSNFFVPGHETEFVLKYQVVEVELIRVQIVYIRWRKQVCKLYIIGRNNHVISLEPIKRRGNCVDSD